MASTVLLTFGLALVLEGAMGEIWGNNSTAIRPSYVDESFTIGGVFLPLSQAPQSVVVLSQITPHAWFLRAVDTLADPTAGLGDIAPSLLVLLAMAALTGGLGLVRARKALVAA